MQRWFQQYPSRSMIIKHHATKCPFDLISQHEAHHVMLQNATAIFMMG
jgi:hypothetical protein